MPVLRASVLIASCPRCTRPIRPNAPIQEYYRDVKTGQVRYAHVGCQPPVLQNQDVDYLPQAQRSALDDEDEGDDGSLEGDIVIAHSDELDQERKLTKPAQQQAALDILRIGGMVRDCIGEAHARLSKELGEQVTQQTEDAKQRVDAQVKGVLDEIRNSARSTLMGAARKIREALAGLEKHQAIKKIVEIQHPGGTVETDPNEVFHPAFDRLIRLCAAGKHSFMPGPTGAGKTHLAGQVARYIPNPDGSVGRPFGSISCRIGMPDYELLGRSLPQDTTGNFRYVPSDFVRCFEQGGVFLLDEVDAGDSNALLTINSALANGFLPVPARSELPPGVTWEDFKANPGKYPGYGPTAYKHPRFVLIAAANTWGSGADRLYVGRNQLDEATLDRFRSYVVSVNYDENAERRFCPEPALINILHDWRKKIFDGRLERVLSTRTIREAYQSIVVDKCQPFVEFAESFFGGWAETEVVAVTGKPLNEYLAIMRDVEFA
jgi:hypothetical protein